MKVKIQFFQAGHCRHLEALAIKGGEWKIKNFPALVALIEHPNFGYYLFDTGYSPRFFETTQNFPESLYAWLAPPIVSEDNTIKFQLQKIGIFPNEIQGIFISHFHADHIAGIIDFPDSKFYCMKAAHDSLLSKNKWGALCNGFLPKLLPSDFSKRVHFIDNHSHSALTQHSLFTQEYDLFSDGSVIAIPLPGHAVGQFGLMCQVVSGESYFLISDACWDCSGYERLQMPNFLSHIITNNIKNYKSTLKKLHHFHKNNPEVTIIPSHCSKTITRLIQDQT